MSANTHITARNIRPTDRFRSLGDLEVKAIHINETDTPTVVVAFTDNDSALVVPADTIVKVWRPFTEGDPVSWVSREWVEQEPAEGDLEDDYGYEEVVTVHRGRVHSVTTPEGETHAVINVFVAELEPGFGEYRDFTSRDLRHDLPAEQTAEVTTV